LNPWILGGIALVFGSAIAIADFQRSVAKEISSRLEGDQKKVHVEAEYGGILGPAFGEVSHAKISASNFSSQGLPFFTEPNRSQAGVIRKLTLDFRDFEVSGLRCESLFAEIPDCRYDFALAKRSKIIRLSRSGTGKAKVLLRFTDLESFVKLKFPEMKEVKITSDGDWLRIDGKGQFLILNADIIVKAKLKTNGTQLFLDDAVVRIDGENPDEPSKQSLIQALNPILDFSKDLDLLDAVTAERIVLSSRSVSIEGKVKIPIKPSE
jgi:hypothetical protein